MRRALLALTAAAAMILATFAPALAQRGVPVVRTGPPAIQGPPPGYQDLAVTEVTAYLMALKNTSVTFVVYRIGAEGNDYYLSLAPGAGDGSVSTSPPPELVDNDLRWQWSATDNPNRLFVRNGGGFKRTIVYVAGFKYAVVQRGDYGTPAVFFEGNSAKPVWDSEGKLPDYQDDVDAAAP